MRMSAPLMMLAQAGSKAAVGAVVAMFAVSQVFLLLPAGRFADRHGLKLPLRLCVLAAASGICLAAIVPNFATLCIAAALCGPAANVANLAIQRHVGRSIHEPSELRRAFSWLSIAPAAANFLGPFMAGIAIDLAGFRTAFALLATMPVLAWLLIRSTPELAPAAPIAAHERAPAWDLLRDPVFRRLLLMNWLITVSWDLHNFMVPVLGHERGLPATVIGGVVGLYAVGAASVRLAMPLLASNLREWVMITGACAATGLLLVAYPFTSSAIAMGVCSAALGLAFGSVQPMVISMLHQITPHHRHGEAIAVRLLSVNVSMVAMPPLLGLATGAIGVSMMFWSMGLLVGGFSPLGRKLRGTTEVVH